MIAETGAFCLTLALGLALAQAALFLAARLRDSRFLAGAGQGAAYALAGAVTLAFFALMAAFVRSDFSIAYVAANSHTEKPLLYRVAGVWGGHEGSLLLWCLVLAVFGALLARGRGLSNRIWTTSSAVQGGLSVLFLGFAVFASNPFLRLADPPVEGRSLNPLLQDPALAFHPPFLYGGYVGLSVVFSLSTAALVEGRVDGAWARWVRPWTLFAWSLLTVGIALGAFWAYYELGWGGWWFWDPVENASFLPWLIATALLHSAIVTERRGAVPGWTVFLGLTAFSCSMLGAFLVRSGVLTSVHAFAVDPTRGLVLLALLGAVAGSGFALFAWRSPDLPRGGAFAAVSREGSLALNNLFLSVAAATVLIGTLYPLVLEAATGRPISVGPPYFNLTFAPLMALALIVLPIGPLLAWRRADPKTVLRRLSPAGAGLLAAFALCLWALAPGRVGAAIGAALGVWIAVGVLIELAGRARLAPGRLAAGLRRLADLPRGAWGMSLAHLGVGLFAIGACLETAARVEFAETLAMGAEGRLGAYRLTLDSVGPARGPNYLAEEAQITVRDGGGRPVCRLSPQRRFYPANRQSTSEVGLCFRGLDDIYVVLGERRGETASPVWLIRAYVNPWARLIFLGPLLMALGGLVSLSDPRVRLAMVRRTVPAGAAA